MMRTMITLLGWFVWCGARSRREFADRERRGSVLVLAGAAWLALAAVSATAAEAPRGTREPLTVDAFSVVRIHAKVVPRARSRATLGPEREGTGIVIDSSGLILTIGYLIQEAESVEIATTDGRSLPASVIAYDFATGFGLLRALKAPPSIAA